MWSLRTKDGRTYGTVRFAGKLWTVFQMGEGEFSHWVTHDND